MPIYEYLCANCGVFEVARPMGTATVSDRCATCGRVARRSYGAPLLNRTPRPLAEALARAEKSRAEPEVVGSVPPRSR